MKNLKDIHYDAFISYRHLEPDSFVAQTLHKRLEAFGLPRSVRDKTGSGKTKIERIFRDEEELPLSDNLSEPINNALANSEFLICVCTPRYLESKWCMREIELFLQTHDRDHILVVLAEGEPEESFPELLTQGGREPLAADTRGVTKKEILSKINTAVLRISAAMFGLNYDDLRQRHREAKLKRLVAFGGAIGVAILVFAVFATVTLIRISRQNVEISEQKREISKQKDTISAQYSDLQEKYAEKMVESAGQTLRKGRRGDAIRDLKSVLPDSKDKPYNVNVMRLLYDVLRTYRVNNQLVPAQIYESDHDINSFDISIDGKYILLLSESKVQVLDSETKEILFETERESEGADSMFYAAFCGSSGIVVIDGASRRYYALDDRDTDSTVTLPEEISEYTSFYQDEDTETALVCGQDSLLAIGDKGEITYRVDLADIFNKRDLEITGIRFDKKLAVAACKDGGGSDLVVFDKASGKPVYHRAEKKRDSVAATVYGNTLYYVASGETGSEAVAVDIRSGKQKWETGLMDKNAVEVTRVGGTIFVRGGAYVTALSTSGEHMPTIYTETPIDTTWTETTEEGGDQFFFLCTSGKVFMYDGSESYDRSENIFQYAPTQEVDQAKRSKEALFYRPMYSDYIVKYAPEIPDTAEKIGEDYTEEDLYADTELVDSEEAEKTAASVEGVDLEGGAQVLFSTDKKYLCVHGVASIDIIDVEAKKCVKTLDVTVDTCEGMRYSEITQGYIVGASAESFILDHDFNIVCTTDKIVGEDKGEFVLWNNDSLTYYRVPFVSYDELFVKLRNVR